MKSAELRRALCSYPAVDGRRINRYPTPTLIAVDVIRPQDVDIDALASRWGAWNRMGRPAGMTCASVEKNFEKGGREATPPSTAPQLTDPQLLAIDTAVRLMATTRNLPKYALTMKFYYVDIEYPSVICRRLPIPAKAFGWWMGLCRSMVKNIMRELHC